MNDPLCAGFEPMGARDGGGPAGDGARDLVLQTPDGLLLVDPYSPCPWAVAGLDAAPLLASFAAYPPHAGLPMLAPDLAPSVDVPGCGADGAGDLTARDFDFASAYAAEHAAGAAFVYATTPTHTTSDDTFSAPRILTPRSTSCGQSRPTSYSDHDARAPGLLLPDDCFFSDADLYNASIQIDLRGMGPVHRSQTVLFDMGTLDDRMLPNPYAPTNTDTGVFYDGHALEIEPPRTAGLKRSANQMAEAAPWNPEAVHDSPHQDPSFATFLPAYGPMAEYDYRQAFVPAGRSPKRVNVTHARDAAGPGRRKSQEYEWEHHFVEPGDGSLRTSKEGSQPEKRLAKRHGPMPSEAAKEAAEVRGLGACWSCWNKKRKCDNKGICQRCTKAAQSSTLRLKISCCRQPLNEFQRLFFISEMIAHLNKKEIEAMIGKHTRGFNNDPFVAQITSGRDFEPITLEVCSFVAESEELTTQHQVRIASDGAGPKSQVFLHGCAPVGLEPGIDMEDLRRKCTAHVRAMVEHGRYAATTTAGQPTEIPYEILRIIQRYYRRTPAAKAGLVHKALMLHGMGFFMDRIVSFTARSTSQILFHYGLLHRADSGEFDFFSSRLLNRQVKFAMHHLHQQLCAAVLKELNDTLKHKDPGSWAAAFATLALLCLCTEEQQVAVDDFTRHERTVYGASPRALAYGAAACQRLDAMVATFTAIFHEIYQTHERKKHFNPFGRRPAVCARWDPATRDMVREVTRLVHDNREEMARLRDPVVFPPAGASGPAHLDLALRNPGRLLSDFLLSFMAADGADDAAGSGHP